MALNTCGTGTYWLRTVSYYTMTKSDAPASSNIKWIALGILGTLGVSLFFRHIAGNPQSDAYLQLGPEGSGMKVSIKPGESVRDFIDRVLDGSDDKQKRALIDQIADRLQEEKSDTPLGKRILKLARSKENPFQWEPIDVTLQHDRTVKELYYQVCSKHQFRDSLVRIAIFDKDGNLIKSAQPLLAGEVRDCLSPNNIIMTSNEKLVEASKQDHARVQAYEVIRIPN